jgi:glutamate N-acetyltransferase/amino-acid N-acetyltransferase
MAHPISPLAPEKSPNLPPIAGLRLASASCAIRYKNRDDLMLMELAPGSAIAGVFTRSLTRAAPVDFCRRNLKGGTARAILVNAGNANAFTGKAGEQSVDRCAKALAGVMSCRLRDVFIASTGVIGEALPDRKITDALPSLAKGLDADHWSKAAAAIMTTDTYPKLASATARIGSTKVTINGICKGSGMIAPDMATMLAFLATDAKLPPAILQRTLAQAVDRSFNCITVDGDTSTNDTVLLAATGKAGAHPKPKSAGDPVLRDFKRALLDVLVALAWQVVKDGEGAEKFVTVEVSGATSAKAARKIALSIANSPLVKTAIAGGDANWGRIVMAVGKSGERADRDRLRIAIGGTVVAEKGQRKPNFDETPIAEHIKGRDIHVSVDVGVGRGSARVWTCDLTHRYIDINADYRS